MDKSTIFLNRSSIQIQGRIMDFDKPKIMSILNLTPDSFYNGGSLSSIDQSVKKASLDLEQGADFLDLGAYSTRPGALDISEEEEWSRLKPHLINLRKHFPEAVISIDTFRPNIASWAIEEGADLINDIMGGNFSLEGSAFKKEGSAFKRNENTEFFEDFQRSKPSIFQVVAEKKVPYILMHSRGNPSTMQNLNYYDSLILDIVDELQKKLYILTELGVRDVIIDPGFGFAKNIEQNFVLLKHLGDFQIFGLPIMVGLSRKSMIYKTLKIPVGESLNGTTAAHIFALQGGASILRVHDVWAASEAIAIWKSFNNS